MQIFISVLFSSLVMLCLIRGYTSEDYECEVKEIPTILIVMVFGLLGFVAAYEAMQFIQAVNL